MSHPTIAYPVKMAHMKDTMSLLLAMGKVLEKYRSKHKKVEITSALSKACAIYVEANYDMDYEYAQKYCAVVIGTSLDDIRKDYKKDGGLQTAANLLGFIDHSFDNKKIHETFKKIVGEIENKMED